MNCKTVEKYIDEVVIGSLDDFTTHEIISHCASCNSCNILLSKSKIVIDRLKLDNRYIKPTEDFKTRLEMQINEAISKKIAKKESSKQFLTRRILLSAAALIIFGVGISFWNVYTNTLGSKLWQSSGFVAIQSTDSHAPIICKGTLIALKKEAGRKTITAVTVDKGKTVWSNGKESIGFFATDSTVVASLSMSGDLRLCLDLYNPANGAVIWSFKSDSKSGYPCRPVITQKNVFWAEGDRLYKLSKEDGHVVSQINLSGMGKGIIQIVCSGDQLYALTLNELQCFDKNSCDQKWTRELDRTSIFSKPVIATGKKHIYLAYNNLSGTTVQSFTSNTGETVWEKSCESVHGIYEEGPTVLIRAQEIIALNTIDGSLVWTKPIDGCAPVTISNNIVYVTSPRDGGVLAGFDLRNGKVVHSFTLDNSCTGILIFGNKGFIQTNSGTIYAIKIG